MRSLLSSASLSMSTSKPDPAITLNVWPLHDAVSRLRRSPRMTRSTISSMSLGRPRPDANRFAVPLGTTANAVCVPTIASDAARTLPSPPHTTIVVAPRFRAFFAAALASEPLSMSTQCTSPMPAEASALRKRRASFLAIFSVLATTAMFVMYASDAPNSDTPLLRCANSGWAHRASYGALADAVTPCG